jgi:hypothetical protein
VRTTVELSDHSRAELLKLAGERGEKGFSRLVQEAIERYLLEQGSRRDRVNAALALKGSLPGASADALLTSVTRARGSWR